LSDKAEGAVADAGATVQEKLNQAGEKQDQLGPVVNSRRRDQRVSYRRVGAELVHFRGMG
jgi:hypothetical protein